MISQQQLSKKDLIVRAIKMKIVIIGNGAAAINAVETIRSMDRNSEIVMVSEEALPAYSCSLLPYYISNEIEKKYF